MPQCCSSPTFTLARNSGLPQEVATTMLNTTAFMQYCLALKLSDEAVEQVQAIRSSEPVRRVQGRGSNVCARYPSRKMGRVIQAESRTVELVGIRCAYEFEPQVLEYWDQPCRIELKYMARNGHLVRVQHTPDYFVLRQDSAGWEEWKPETQMEKLAEKMPNRYQQAEGGQWCCPPGEAFAAQFGLYYHVRTSAEFSPIYQRNVALLEDYLLSVEHETAPAAQEALVAFVAEQPGVSLEALQTHFTSDELFSAVARGDLFVDLDAAPLMNANQVMVFASAELARAMTALVSQQAHGQVDIEYLESGAVLLWDERIWQVVNMGRESIALLSDESNGRLVELSRTEFKRMVTLGRITLPVLPAATEASERIRQASPAALKRATQRLQAVEALLAGREPDLPCSPRTLRHYKRRYLEAKARWGTGLVGLLDDNNRKGNRDLRLSVESHAHLEQFIKQSYETLKQKSVLRVYGEYVMACEEQGIQAASYTTFSQKVKARPRAEQILNRQGKRAAYQAGPQNWWLSYDTPRHGDFPWQYGHIDHTQLNVEMVCSTTGRVLGRPWLTVLLDAFSRRIPSVYITFDPPSYRSCMAVLVECVLRHERLPQQVVVDNGPEFRSTYFETLLAHYHVTKLSRPAAQPRAGSLIERLFRTSETEFVHNLRGNTQIMKQGRQVTAAVNPKNQAVWTLESFYEYFCTWSYEVYDQMLHSTLEQSPREAYLAGLAATGLRPNRRIVYDETFRILMLPTTKRGEAKVMPGRGVKVNYLYYWCDAFRQPSVEATTVPIRYDPFNAGIAYAYVNGLWQRCISERYAAFQGHTEREIALATAALRQRKRLDRRQMNINAQVLAAFLTSVEGQETLLEQKMKDRAIQQVRNSISDLGAGQPDLSCPPDANDLMASSLKRSVKWDSLEEYGDLIL